MTDAKPLPLYCAWCGYEALVTDHGTVVCPKCRRVGQYREPRPPKPEGVR